MLYVIKYNYNNSNNRNVFCCNNHIANFLHYFPTLPQGGKILWTIHFAQSTIMSSHEHHKYAMRYHLHGFCATICDRGQCERQWSASNILAQIFLIVKGQATICLKYDIQHNIVSYNANYAMIKFFAQNQSRLF